MAEPKRREDDWGVSGAGEPAPWAGVSGGSAGAGRSGGPVGQMQADLVRRLSWETADDPATPAGERLVHRLSIASGFLALSAGYAGAAYLVLR